MKKLLIIPLLLALAAVASAFSLSPLSIQQCSDPSCSTTFTVNSENTILLSSDTPSAVVSPDSLPPGRNSFTITTYPGKFTGQRVVGYVSVQEEITPAPEASEVSNIGRILIPVKNMNGIETKEATVIATESPFPAVTQTQAAQTGENQPEAQTMSPLVSWGVVALGAVIVVGIIIWRKKSS